MRVSFGAVGRGCVAAGDVSVVVDDAVGFVVTGDPHVSLRSMCEPESEQE
jgi:hypothetical protein